jgi:hypothetical protein
MITHKTLADLSRDVMNLKCRVPDDSFAPDGAQRIAYKEGHRDARHAVCEMLCELVSKHIPTPRQTCWRRARRLMRTSRQPRSWNDTHRGCW